MSLLPAGKSVLVIAHRMRTVEAADKIVVLKNGEVTEQGSPAALLQNPQAEMNIAGGTASARFPS